ncbi:mRNA interferase RelE/StbE [Desulfonatronum thiosulfatophilum]|uniref:mRNA interferase RelE/StbE n=1 Tax=Desulfonatronum thiosulfatophilum TaxID=617002 RepID=A0A1G6ECH2_9BACT|nr:mRNA interferase RelE/StbE [Desulfonatronum thiosulfatophilum]
MTYSISIKRSAAKSLENIPKPDRLRIIEAIDFLRENSSAGSVLKGEFSGLRRIRVGMYRVVYEVQDTQLTILIVRIGHRRGVYR